MAAIDFSLPPGVLTGVVSALAVPAALVALSRVPSLAGRNALQFSLAAMAGSVVGLAYFFADGPIVAMRWKDAVLALAVFVSFLLLFLEAWALMSRGYTLGLLLTLHERGPLSEAELASNYRGGAGLQWIMRHRLGGLVAAGMVTRSKERIALTPVTGVIVARLYRSCVRALGLRKTG